MSADLAGVELPFAMNKIAAMASRHRTPETALRTGAQGAVAVAWTIHNANHLRPNRDGLKVGGHQASCASLATMMTALYF